MKQKLIRPLAVCVLLAHAALLCAQTPASKPPPTEPAGADGSTLLKKIAFGSCAKQDKPQPIWDPIVSEKPDLFLFIGDNIYGDSDDMDVLRSKYAQLGAIDGFKNLKAACPILATWDDHDFGQNDAGADFARRKESQQVFLDFFEEPAASPRRSREGVYDSRIFGPIGKQVQIILLDTRYFRSPMKKRDDKEVPGDGRPGPYVPNSDPQATVLGEAQWSWLEKQLLEKADLRIIASSIQFIAAQHGYEKWMNFPLERERMLRLIARTNATGVVFISGDRHSAELSRIKPASDAAAPAGGIVKYPLYDLTSSPLNQTRRFTNEWNDGRIGSVFFEPNFGVIEMDWSAASPRLSLRIHDVKGVVVIRHDLPLSELQ